MLRSLRIHAYCVAHVHAAGSRIYQNSRFPARGGSVAWKAIPVRPAESIAAGASTAEREGRSAGRIPDHLIEAWGWTRLLSRREFDGLCRFASKVYSVGGLSGSFVDSEAARQASERELEFMRRLSTPDSRVVWFQAEMIAGARHAHADPFAGRDPLHEAFRELGYVSWPELTVGERRKPALGMGVQQLLPVASSLSQLNVNEVAGPPPPSAGVTNRAQPIQQPVRTTPMPSPQKVWIRKVNVLIRELEHTDLSKRHVGEYRRVCREAGRELAAAGLACTPSRFRDAHFDHLYYDAWRRVTSDRPGLAPQTVAYNFCLLSRFLERFGNTTAKRRLAQVRIPKYQVRPITPLSEDQANRVLGAAMRRGVEPGAFVALELLGLRRSSVLRLKVADLRDEISWAEVWVKNKGGERKEEIRIPPFVRVRLLELLARRAQELVGVDGPDPGYLFAHVLGGKIVAWSKAYVDRNWIVPAFREAGIVMPGTKNHGLRKAAATALSDRGVAIEKVARQLHHQDPKTTLRYIRSARQDLESNALVLEEAFGDGARKAPEVS